MFFLEDDGARGAHDKKSQPPKTLKSCHSRQGQPWRSLEHRLPSAPLASDCRSREIGDPRVSRFLGLALLHPAVSSTSHSLPPTIPRPPPPNIQYPSLVERQTSGFNSHSIPLASREKLLLCSIQQLYRIIEHFIESHPAKFPSRTTEASNRPTDTATDQPIDSIDRHTNHTSSSYLLPTRNTLCERRKHHRDLLQDKLRLVVCRRSF